MYRRSSQRMRWLMTCAALFIPLLALSQLCSAQTPPTASPQTATEQVLTKLLQDYVAHFNARDFDSLSKLLSETVSYNDESTRISGAGTLVDGLRKLSTDEPSVKLEIEIQTIDQTSDDAASAHGIATLASDTTPAESSRFTVAFQRQAETWRILTITESAIALTGADAIESLQWLVGSWQDAENPTLQTTVSLVPGNQFLQRTVERRTDDETVQIATEMIGYDPTIHQVRSWLFFADGSFGSGTWQGESDHCKIRLQQTMVDGSIATGTYVIRPTGRDSMTIQMISRVINGELQPLGQPTTLTRVSAASSSTTHDTKGKP